MAIGRSSRLVESERRDFLPAAAQGDCDKPDQATKTPRSPPSSGQTCRTDAGRRMWRDSTHPADTAAAACRRTFTISLSRYHISWTKMLLLVIWAFLMQVRHGTGEQGLKQHLSVSEDAAVGQIVGTVGQDLSNPPDPPYMDLNPDDQVTPFDFSEDGSIRVKEPLDRETKREYTLVLLSLQSGESITIAVEVTDVNDNAPVFPNPVINMTFSESVPLDVKSPLGSALDADEGINTTQRYEIVEGNVAEAFRLGTKRASNGILYLDLEINEVLDYEETSSYSLVIRAYDGGSPPKYGSMRVNINVVDANDNQPLFNPTRYNAKVPENSTIGASVLQVYATDRDSGENGQITYQIDRTRSDASEKFRVDPDNGVVFVQKKLDYEAKQNYELVVVAQDNGPQKLQATAIVSIEVQDINDNAPVIDLLFLTADGSGKISETAQAGDFVARISVSDPDIESGVPDIEVTLSGGEGYFGLTTRDNVKYLVILEKSLDREFQPYYTLTVVATDDGTPPLTSTKSFTVYVTDTNDNPPVFTESIYYADIQEVVPPGSSVIQLTAQDDDDADNSLIVYELSDTPDTHSDWFAIDSRTGLIVTRAPVDCEAVAETRLTVVATDSGTPPLSATATVVVRILDVNDNQPIFDQSFYNVSVSESVTTGSCILTVSATDRDCGANAQVRYTIASNLGFQSPSEFEVKSTSGRVCVTAPLDFEKRRTYDFPIVASDQDGLDTTAMVKVIVLDANDNNPVFYPSRYTVNLEETSATGAEVVTVKATDRDTGSFGTVSYAISGGNHDGQFSVDAATGVVKLAKPLPSHPRLYNVAVRATDGAGLLSLASAYVNITILGRDQNPPEFASPLYKFSIAEDRSLNTLVGKIGASAPGNPRVSYSIASGDTAGLFRIDSVSGEIRVASLLDHDTTSKVLLNIQAEAGSPPSFGSAQVNITITDVNDNAPIFSVSSIEIPVKEDVTLTSTIYVVQATDRDSGDNGRVRYSVEDGSDTFTVDSSTGEIRLQRLLDHETTPRHQFTITAYDQGSPSKSAAITVHVVVQDCNDNPPAFSQSVYSFDVAESTHINTKFARVTATDADSGNNGRVSYLVQDEQNLDVFGIFSEDGWLYNRLILDRESNERYTLRVIAIDNGVPARSGTAEVIVNVLDANDNPPEFEEDGYLFYQEEGLAVGSPLGTVHAQDRDQSDRLVYTLLGSTDYFSINPTSGSIKTRRVLDREQMETHEFRVKVADSGDSPQSATVGVRVQVLDVNDNAPVFDRNRPLRVSVPENRPKHTIVALVAARDGDKGENQSISYSFGSSGKAADHARFEINARTGQITTRAVLDHEQQSLYTLTVVAADGGAPPRSTSMELEVTVEDENESAPEFENTHVAFEVRENTLPGRTVGSVVAQDKDSGENAKIRYYIVSGNLFGTFGVNSTTGAIHIARPVDYEESSGYSIHIRAIDSSPTKPMSSIIKVNITVIDVNDNAPVFEENPVVVSMREHTAVGTHVYTLSAVDPDSGDRGHVQYEIKSQSPDGDWFSIERNNGYLSVKADIDYETTPQVSVVIEASDQPQSAAGRLHSTVTALILVEDVNDNRPTFEMRDTFDVMEDEPIGYPVIHVIATDADSHDNGKLTYSVVSGNEESHFHLESSSGLLTIAKPLDRESTSFYSLNISAKDYGHPRMAAHKLLTVHVVDVNDNAPVFEHSVYMANITEQLPVDTVVTSIKAQDSDLGINAALVYLLPAGIANNTFRINMNTGELTTNTVLDREHQSHWTITAYVKDTAFPALYDTTTVLVSVLDVNDNSPVFKDDEYYLEVPENSHRAVVHTVMASDADSGKNGVVTYSIQGGNSGGKFAIDPQSGELSCSPLDREEKSVYLLNIMATDGGYPPRHSTSSIQVKVLDINDNDPRFASQQYTKSIPEDMAGGTSILQVEASDVDEGVNTQISYSLSHDAKGQFRIDNITGVIYTSGMFDREKTDGYSFEVSATDGGLYDPRSESVRVDVTILDVNDNSPVFETIPYKAEIPQNLGVNQFVTRVSAVDKDDGVNAQVHYSFKEGAHRFFAIHGETGEITIRKPLLDPSAVDIHHIDITARDMGSPARSTEGVVEIRVGDARELTTLRFTNMTYQVALDEDAATGTEVVKVEARFSSGGPGTIRYSFASSTNDDGIFNIHELTGVVTVKDGGRLDYESAARVRLIVIAESTDAYGYTTVWVRLRDVNDNRPRFTQDRYTSRVWEGNPRGTFVAQVVAKDADEGENGRVSYTIRGNVPFVIDPPHTGIVKTNIILDREIAHGDSYKLVVEAYDHGAPQQTSTCILRIQVIDTNDNTPNFPPQPIRRLREGTALGTMIAHVTANDIDLNPQLVYQFAGGGNPDEAFTIDRYNAKISVAKQLDYEYRKQYHLVVMASDSDHNATSDVIVEIIDENDNPPVFAEQSYEVTVFENTGPQVSVITIGATDLDSGKNSKLTYNMLAVNGFYINPQTGAVYTNKTVRYNPGQPTIHLVVTAYDNGSPSLSAQVAVRVLVIDVNDHAPVFTRSVYSGVVREDEKKGVTILTVTATDQDVLKDNKKVDFSILGGDMGHLFHVDQGTGGVTLTGALDRERTAQYTLTVRASDRGDPQLNSTALVKISVQDVNDNSPLFNRSEYRAVVNEAVAVGTSVTRVFATDQDDGLNGQVEYTIMSGNDYNCFEIEHDTGLISVRTRLDHETSEIHRLIVRAEDTSMDFKKMSAFATVIVNVTDENESKPQFPVMVYLETVLEDEPVGTLAFTAHANDEDGGRYGVITYRLVSLPNEVDITEYFQIDGASGEVRTTVVFDSAMPSTYQFLVKAYDAGGEPGSVHAMVSIKSRDEFTPVFANVPPKLVVPGNAANGTRIMRFVATDEDGGTSAYITYALKAPNEFFGMESRTGWLVVIRDLQEDKQENALRRRRRHARRRRALETSAVELTIVAHTGSATSEAVVHLEIDRSCEGCAMKDAQTGDGGVSLTGTPLILLLVFTILAVVIAVVIVLLYLRGRKKKRHPPANAFDSNHSFATMDSMAPPPPNRQFAPPPYNEAQPHHYNITTSERSENSHSASSGRGSAEEGDEVDEEIRMINATPMQAGHRMPDSGIQQDDDAMSEHSVHNHQEYLARLGIDSSKITNKNKVGSSVESMHQFSDEGGGEGDGMDIGSLVYTNLRQQETAENLANMDGTRQFGFGDSAGETSHGGSLSSVINSEEEFSGSYNWDYLLDWGPQYQPLAAVFSEIARLKDDNIKPLTKPTQIVPQQRRGKNSVDGHLVNQAMPPPIITDAPPKGFPLAQTSQNQSNSNLSSSSNANSINSARTSQLTNVSLPKSPLSYESSYGSAVMSPSFTPSLSPLGTRSPSISPLVTPKGIGSVSGHSSHGSSGHNSPGPMRVVRKHRQANGVLFNGHLASSESEQEFRI